MSLDRFSVPIATKNQKKKLLLYLLSKAFLTFSKKLLFSFDSLLSLTTKQSFSSSSLFSRFVPIFLEGERQANIVRAPLPQSMVAKVTVGRAPGVRVSVCVFAGKVSAKTFYIASLHCHLINFERHRYCFTRMGSATRPAETKLRRV